MNATKVIRAFASVAFSMGLASSAFAGAPSVLDKAYLWLDASADDTIVTNATGNVTNWRTRSASGKSATAYNAGGANAGPTLTRAFVGSNIVDFGTVGSGKDLKFDATSNVRAVFMVADVYSSANVFILGDETQFHFHRHHEAPNLRFFHDTNSSAALRNGQIRRNGVSVGNAVLPMGYGLITLIPTAGVSASRICQDRKEGSRTGGKRIAELIIFTEAITDAQRDEIEQYLTAKWMTLSPLPTFSLGFDRGKGASTFVGGSAPTEEVADWDDAAQYEQVIGDDYAMRISLSEPTARPNATLPSGMSDSTSWSVHGVMKLSNVTNGVLFGMGGLAWGGEKKIGAKTKYGIGLERPESNKVSVVYWSKEPDEGAHTRTTVIDNVTVRGSDEDYHVYMLTFNSAAKGTAESPYYTLYVDGVEAGNSGAGARCTGYCASANWCVGNYYGGATSVGANVFTGAMVDDFALWKNTCLSPVQVVDVAKRFAKVYTATITNSVNWSEIAWDPQMPAGGFEPYAVLSLTPTADAATVTMDAPLKVYKLFVRSEAGHNLALAPSTSDLDLSLYDFSLAKGQVTVGFSTLAADVSAGANTILAEAGTGTLTIGNGAKASVPNWTGTKDLRAGGTLRFTGEGQRGLNDDTVSDATVELAGKYDITANSVLITTNAKLRVSGEVVTSSTGIDTGMKGGTTLEIAKTGTLLLNGRFVWNYDSQKAAVSSDINMMGGELKSEGDGFLYAGSWANQTANLNQSGGTNTTRLAMYANLINDNRLNVNVSGGTFAPSVIGLTTDGTTVLPGEDATITNSDAGAFLALSGGTFEMPASVPNWFTVRVPVNKTATIVPQDAAGDTVQLKSGLQLGSGATLYLGAADKTIAVPGGIDGANATVNLVAGTLDVTASEKVALKSLTVKPGAVLRISAEKPLVGATLVVEDGGKIDFVTDAGTDPHILSATTGKLKISAAQATDAFLINGQAYAGEYKWYVYDGDFYDEAAIQALCITYGAGKQIFLTTAIGKEWTTATIPGNPTAARKSERTDREAKVSPTIQGEGIDAYVRIIENKELNYTQYEVVVTNTTEQPITIGSYYLLWQWAPVDFPADGVINGGTQGPVVQYRNARGYLGVENPQTDITCENGYATCVLKRNYAIKPGEAWSVKWVYGTYSEESQLRREFQAYLDNERAHPYRVFPHYNSWYDLCIDCKDDPDELKRLTEEKMYTSITNFRHHLSIEHKVWMKSYLADDGWDRWESLWDFHAGFANGFTNLYNTVKVDEGSSISCWMSPCGGYGSSFQKRLKYAKEHGYVPWSAQVLKLSMPGYYSAFRDRAISMITDYDMNLFKFDRMGSGGDCTGAGPEYAPDIAAVVRLTGEMRAKKQDVFINCTVGTWASPFWVMYADSIWRGEGDYGGQGDKWTIGTTVRQRWITYRDNVIYNRFANPNPLFPLNSLMNHGIIVANKGSDGTSAAWSKVDTDEMLQDFCDEMWMSMACGTDLQEYYISPTLMHDRWWAALATGIKWLEANQETLRDVHWVGGDPFNEAYGERTSGKQGAIYGYASWKGSSAQELKSSKGILILRNSHDQPLTFTSNFATIFELPSGCDTMGISSVTNVFSHKKDLADYFKMPLTAYENVTFKLDAYDVMLIEVELGSIDKYVAEMTEDKANLQTGTGLTEYAGSWTNDANRVIVITNAFEAATLDLGEAVTAACFVACQPASGALALTSASVPEIPYYAVRGGTLGLPENVAMDATSFVTDKGATLLVTKSGLRETHVQNAGTLRFVGGTAESPLAYAADGAKDGRLGAFALADKAYLKVTTTDNKVYNVTGAGAHASTLEVSCPTKGTGTTDGSAFRNLTLVANAGGDGFWIERKDSFDATVDLVASNTVVLCNHSQTIGSLFGAGDIRKNGEANIYTLTITPSVDAEYSGASPHRFTIAASDFAETLSGNYTGELTVEPGGKCRLTGSACPHSIENNGTLNVTTIRGLTIRGTGKVDVVMTAAEESSKDPITVFDYAATGEKPTIGRVFDESGADITARVEIVGNTIRKRSVHGLMLFCK